MKYCNEGGYCGYRYQEGSLQGCKYEGYCDFQLPRDSKPAEQTVPEDYQDVLATVMTERDKYREALEKIEKVLATQEINRAYQAHGIAKTALEGGE